MLRTSGFVRVIAIASVMVVVAAGMVDGAVPAAGSAGATAAPVTAPAPAFDTAFAQLRQDLASIVSANLTVKNAKSSATAWTISAQQQAEGGLLCAAVRLVNQVRQLLARIAGLLAARLYQTLVADVLTLLAALLGDPSTAGCGGSRGSSSPGPAPAFAVGKSDNRGVDIHVAFPTPRFTAYRGGGGSYLRMFEAGIGRDGHIGEPETPMTGANLAVPINDTVSVSITGLTSYQLTGINLWPTQPDQVMTSDPPSVPTSFTKDAHTYSSTRPYPATLQSAGPVTAQRDLHVSTISLAGARYVPAFRTLQVVTALDVHVTFNGPVTAVFGNTSVMSVWNLDAQPVYGAELLNWPAVSRYLTPVPPAHLCGEQLLIISSAVDRAAADALAAARTSAGVLAKVAQVGTGGVGTTATSIRDYVRHEYTLACAIHPAYVLLMGDAASVPPFAITFTGGVGKDLTSNGDNPVASDAPYGYLHQADQVDAGLITDFRPDVLVGRLPGTAADALTAVGKIIAYEQHPPADPAFYQDATVASYFQDCPHDGCFDGTTAEQPSTQDQYPNLRASEQARAIVQAGGKTVGRVTTDEPDDTPKAFDDGAPIPPDVSFLSNGGTAELTSAINAGSFLVIHVDHGWGSGDGWVHPQLGTGELDQLSNGALLPVAWSIDCDSGKFDGLGHAFAGRIVSRAGGGAVAAIASTRLSYATPDGYLAAELANAAFPTLHNQVNGGIPPGGPYQPSVLDPVTRVADTLAVAQAATAADVTDDVSHNPVAQTGLLTFEEFGDPTMEMWTAQPQYFHTNDVTVTPLDPNHLRVQLAGQPEADGAAVTLAVHGTYLGRAVLHDGTATLAYTGDISGNGVRIIFAKPQWVSGTVNFPSRTRPHVSKVSPNFGKASDIVAIEGDGFADASAVTFGGIPATFTVVDDTILTAKVPPAPAGTGAVDVVVTNPLGDSPVTAADVFHYPPTVTAINPNEGPTTGGQTITVTGSGFLGAAAVNLVGTLQPYFGTLQVAAFTVVDDHTIVATTPAKAPNQVSSVYDYDVQVVTPAGTSAINNSAVYSYLDQPEITGVTPNTGPDSGGNEVQIAGFGFTGTSALSFGGSPTADFSVLSDQDIVVHHVPPGAIGTVDVRITTPGGITAISPSDQYTYVGKE